MKNSTNCEGNSLSHISCASSFSKVLPFWINKNVSCKSGNFFQDLFIVISLPSCSNNNSTKYSFCSSLQACLFSAPSHIFSPPLPSKNTFGVNFPRFLSTKFEIADGTSPLFKPLPKNSSFILRIKLVLPKPLLP